MKLLSTKILSIVIIILFIVGFELLGLLGSFLVSSGLTIQAYNSWYVDNVYIINIIGAVPVGILVYALSHADIKRLLNKK